MSEPPKTVDINDEDEDKLASDLALGFAITMPVCSLIGLLLFDQFGFGIAAGVILGPVMAMILRRIGHNQA